MSDNPIAAKTPSQLISAAQDVSDLAVKAANNPQLMAVLQQEFGSRIGAAQKSPLGMAAGALLGMAFTQFGIKGDPNAVMLVGIMAAILGGDLWQWAQGKWFTKQPPPPSAAGPLTAALLAIGLTAGVLVSCSTAPNVPQAIADAQIVADGVANSYATLKQIDPGLTNSATDAQIEAILGRLPDAMAQLRAATTTASQASGLRAVEADVNGVLNLAAGIVAVVPGVPPAVVLGLQAAEVLLPVIEGVANQLVRSPTGAPAAPAVLISAMTPDQARATLAAVAARR